MTRSCHRDQLCSDECEGEVGGCEVALWDEGGGLATTDTFWFLKRRQPFQTFTWVKVKNK